MTRRTVFLAWLVVVEFPTRVEQRQRETTGATGRSHESLSCRRDGGRTASRPRGAEKRPALSGFQAGEGGDRGRERLNGANARAGRRGFQPWIGAVSGLARRLLSSPAAEAVGQRDRPDEAPGADTQQELES